MRKRVNKRAVDSLKPGNATTYLWDPELPGFGVRVTPAGVRSYVFQWQRGGRSRRLTIGRHGAPWTAEQARREALRLKAEVAAGADPAAESAAARTAPTVADLSERFVSEHVATKCKATTGTEYQRILRLWILPRLGSIRVADVSRADVAKLHHDMRDRRYQANQARAVLSKMFTLAERWGLRPDNSNPCRHVERFGEEKRERYLSPAELARLGEALRWAEGEGAATLKPAPFAIEAIRVLLLTGCRRDEILCLRWDDVDLEAGRITIRESKTGRKALPLSAPAAAVLARMPRLDVSPFVFPGRGGKGRLVGLRKCWVRIREAAGLPDVRIHDLRHSFASVGAGGGETLLLIGGLLGHKVPATTARYAHLADDPLRAASERIADRIASQLDGRPSGDVVPLPVRRR